MKVLFAIPHYFKGTAAGRHGSLGPHARARADGLRQCVLAIHQLFGRGQQINNIARRNLATANDFLAGDIDVVICTTGEDHLLREVNVAAALYEHRPTGCEPPLLGFQCHAVLRERLGSYDWYCYLEDDLVIHDPWFFAKLAEFTRQAGGEALLQPNRYEVSAEAEFAKLYIDGDLADHVTVRFQDVRQKPQVVMPCWGTAVTFRRARNPHSGCFFLNAEQMAHWAARQYFLDRDVSFVGPLESAATLGIMRTFRVYKPTPRFAAFLEIQHRGTAFIRASRHFGRQP